MNNIDLDQEIDIAALLLQERKKLDYNKSQMSRKLHISSQLYGQYENRKRNPDLFDLNNRWKKAFGKILVSQENDGKNETSVSRETKDPNSFEELAKVLMKSLAAFSETQNLILQQNQVQVIGGLNKLQSDFNQNRKDNLGMASAISDDLKEWSLLVLKSLQGQSPGGASKQVGKNVQKLNEKIEKRDIGSGNHKGGIQPA